MTESLVQHDVWSHLLASANSGTGFENVFNEPQIQLEHRGQITVIDYSPCPHTLPFVQISPR